MTRLLVLGDLNLDVIVRDDRERQDEPEIRSVVRARPGGSAGTFARVAAAHGAAVTFVGAVGKDGVGDLLERSLIDAHVTPRLVRSPLPSGVIVALQRGSEHSMICSRGANDALSCDAVGADLLAESDHLHISGYALLSAAQWPAVEKALALAHQYGLTISVDPPPGSLVESFGVRSFLERIPYGTWLFPNESEGRILADEATSETVVDRLAQRAHVGALTLGGAGSIAWRGEERNAQGAIPVEAATAVGAGDAFAGAFVAEMLDSADLSAAHCKAVAAAHGHLLDGLAIRS